MSGQRLGRGVGERGDSVQPHWAFVPREGRGNLVGDRLQAIHSQELPVRRQGRGSLRRERREPVEPEHPVVLSERGGRPCGELLQTCEAEVSVVRGKQFDLAVGDPLQARQPEVAVVLAHAFGNFVADGRDATEPEDPWAGGSDEGKSGIEWQFGETIEFEHSVLLREHGGRLRRERRQAVEHDRAAATTDQFGHPRRQDTEMAELQITMHAGEFRRLLDRELRHRGAADIVGTKHRAGVHYQHHHDDRQQTVHDSVHTQILV